MAYRRTQAPLRILSGDALTRACVGIGMLFVAEPSPSPNIEDTVFAASVEGMEQEELRMLAILVTWLEVHHPQLNASRLAHRVRAYRGERVRAFWSAVAQWLSKDRRLSRLAACYDGPRLDLVLVGADFMVRRSGEDERFAGTVLRVPKGVLRDRKGDVLPAALLAERHQAYRHRILLGPSYRADVWAELASNPTLSAAELARRTYASFATAWQAKRDWAILQGVSWPEYQRPALA